MYNFHIHCFTNKHIPIKIMGEVSSFLVKHPLAGTVILKSAGLFFNLPFLKNDLYDRVHRYFTIGAKKDQKEILDTLIKTYPLETKFVVLPMDFENMGCGPSTINFENQLEELANIAKEDKYKNKIKPFVPADPRRSNFLEIVKQYIEKEGFQGIKIYPPLGYFPQDERLEPLYEYAIKKNIPVITHSQIANSLVKLNGNQSSIISTIKNSDWFNTDQSAIPIKYLDFLNNLKNQDFKKSNTKELCSVFAHPANYFWILSKFPELKLSLAHFGGKKEWEKFQKNKSNWTSIIVDLILDYDNVYTDISAFATEKKWINMLKDMLLGNPISDKVIYGSDFYMTSILQNEKSIYKALVKHMPQFTLDKLMIHNPEKFLDKSSIFSETPHLCAVEGRPAMPLN